MVGFKLIFIDGKQIMNKFIFVFLSKLAKFPMGVDHIIIIRVRGWEFPGRGELIGGVQVRKGECNGRSR